MTIMQARRDVGQLYQEALQASRLGASHFPCNKHEHKLLLDSAQGYIRHAIDIESRTICGVPFRLVHTEGEACILSGAIVAEKEQTPPSLAVCVCGARTPISLDQGFWRVASHFAP